MLYYGLHMVKFITNIIQQWVGSINKLTFTVNFHH
jgi:hypothetical protein